METSSDNQISYLTFLLTLAPKYPQQHWSPNRLKKRQNQVFSSDRNTAAQFQC